MILKSIVLAVSFVLLSSSPESSTLLTQGCSGCAPSDTAQEDYDYAANGGYVVLIVTAGAGVCGMVLSESGVECGGTHCSIFASYGAVNLWPGASVSECTGLVGAKTREDCKTPTGVVDANGNYSAEEGSSIPCGSGSKYYSMDVSPLHAEIAVTCYACVQ